MSKPSNDPETLEQPDLVRLFGVVTRACPSVRWTDSGGEHEFIVESNRAVIGSGGGVDVQLADPLVSRLHAEFELGDNGLWVTDLGSKNGSYVNGVRVRGARIPPNGVVQLGSTELRVHYGAPPMPVDVWPEEGFGQLVGKSVLMRELFAKLARIAKLDDGVLIQGETGTGKELVARAIHDHSPRAQAPFAVVDCAALPGNLLEVELFGHAKGAFTGASDAREGTIEAAAGGTVLLDEIGELPLELQPKLLRVIESHSLRRLGETEFREVDVRFIAATHRNLREMVNNGTFREDLYFRIAVFPVLIPPLRDRVEDIPLLIKKMFPNQPEGTIPPELMRVLRERPWSGNVRELRNFVNRAAVFGASEAAETMQRPRKVETSEMNFSEARTEMIHAFERQYVKELLERHGHNVTAAAEAAGITRVWLHKLVRKHSL